MVILPAASVHAVKLYNQRAQPDHPVLIDSNLERIRQHEQYIHLRQDHLLDRADQFINKPQHVIDRLSAKGKEVNNLKAAIDSFIDAIKDTRLVHEEAERIITPHKGHNANREVIA